MCNTHEELIRSHLSHVHLDVPCALAPPRITTPPLSGCIKRCRRVTLQVQYCSTDCKPGPRGRLPWPRTKSVRGIIRFACSVTNASLAGGRARLRGRRHSIGGSSRSDVVKLRGLQQTTDETVVRSCCTGNSAIRTASVRLTPTVVSATLYAPRPRVSLYRVGSGLELLCAPDVRILAVWNDREA